MKGHDVAEILVTLAILYLLGTVFFDEPTTEQLYPEPVYTQQQFNDLLNIFTTATEEDKSLLQQGVEGLLEILNQLPQYDYVIEIMCTNPFKTVEDIDSVIEKLSNSKGNSVTSVTRIWDNHPNRVKFISNLVILFIISIKICKDLFIIFKVLCFNFNIFKFNYN